MQKKKKENRKKNSIRLKYVLTPLQFLKTKNYFWNFNKFQGILLNENALIKTQLLVNA